MTALSQIAHTGGSMCKAHVTDVESVQYQPLLYDSCGNVLSLRTLILSFYASVQVLLYLRTQASFIDFLRSLGGTFPIQSRSSRADLATLSANSFAQIPTCSVEIIKCIC